MSAVMKPLFIILICITCFATGLIIRGTFISAPTLKSEFFFPIDGSYEYVFVGDGTIVWKSNILGKHDDGWIVNLKSGELDGVLWDRLLVWVGEEGVRSYKLSVFNLDDETTHYDYESLIREPLRPIQKWKTKQLMMSNAVYTSRYPETTITPAGTFECVHLECPRPFPGRGVWEYWYARGVGMVQYKENDILYTLQSYRRIPQQIYNNVVMIMIIYH